MKIQNGTLICCQSPGARVTVLKEMYVQSVGLMTSIAAPYFKQITAACEVRPSGVPRKSDEELEALLNGSKNTLINVIGWVGLLSILYLMIFKPWV